MKNKIKIRLDDSGRPSTICLNGREVKVVDVKMEWIPGARGALVTLVAWADVETEAGGVDDDV